MRDRSVRRRKRPVDGCHGCGRKSPERRCNMTRNLTAEDKRSAFVRATCSMSGAADRWKSRAATGLTDEQLHDALKFELGIFGGSTSHGNCPDLMFQGNGLKI